MFLTVGSSNTGSAAHQSQIRRRSGLSASTSANRPPESLLPRQQLSSCYKTAAPRLQSRCKAASSPPAASTGGGSGGGIAPPRGGGLGGSGDGGGEGTGPKRRGFTWSGWEARVAADPEFVYKILVEQIIGVSAAVLGDMSSRPYWGLYELDFVFSTLVVGSLLNFSLMYFLAPTAASGSTAAVGGLMSRIFSNSMLKAWGAPGGHMFEAGFPLRARLLNLAYKGGMFGVVGLGAGLAGTAVSNGLIAIRKALDPKFESQNALPNVLLNASCWGAHMGVSSNIRYQLINGLEMVLQPKMSAMPFRVLTSLVRTGNNILGGVSFVLLAKVMGVQQSQGDEAKEQEKAGPGNEDA